MTQKKTSNDAKVRLRPDIKKRARDRAHGMHVSLTRLYQLAIEEFVSGKTDDRVIVASVSPTEEKVLEGLKRKLRDVRQNNPQPEAIEIFLAEWCGVTREELLSIL